MKYKNQQHKHGYWLAILDNLPLTKNDLGLVQKFKQDPEGRGFLSVAEILKEHNYEEECLELLQIGVLKHKRFTAARVVLAREFFGRGMIEEALAMIEDSPVNLHLNILAQKIRLKSLLILGKEDCFRKVLTHLTQGNALDSECQRLGQSLYLEGFAQTKASFVQKLIKDGIIVNYSQTPNAKEQEEHLPQSQSMTNYSVIPVDKIFFKDDKSNAAFALETETLAQVYEDQGYYQGALKVYHRLAKKYPSNSIYRHKVIELTQLANNLHPTESGINYRDVAMIEQYDCVNFKLRVCRSFLQKLV